MDAKELLDGEAGDVLARLGTDGQQWARAFLALDIDPDNYDEGLMIGWFANAIEAGRSAEQPAIIALTEQVEALREAVRGAFGLLTIIGSGAADEAKLPAAIEAELARLSAALAGTSKEQG